MLAAKLQHVDGSHDAGPSVQEVPLPLFNEEDEHDENEVHVAFALQQVAALQVAAFPLHATPLPLFRVA